MTEHHVSWEPISGHFASWEPIRDHFDNWEPIRAHFARRESNKGQQLPEFWSIRFRMSEYTQCIFEMGLNHWTGTHIPTYSKYRTEPPLAGYSIRLYLLKVWIQMVSSGVKMIPKCFWVCMHPRIPVHDRTRVSTCMGLSSDPLIYPGNHSLYTVYVVLMLKVEATRINL